MAFFSCVAASKQLSTLRSQLLGNHSVIDVEDSILYIERTKNITFNRVERANTAVCLQAISNIHAVIAVIERTKKTPFSWSTADDRSLIEAYWTAMFPEVRRQHSTVSEEWGELGFQGNDPSSDFRGMGMLGLQQLEYFARTRGPAARGVLSEAMHPRRYYPFSATGINVTAFVLQLLRERRLHQLLLGVMDGRTVTAAHKDLGTVRGSPRVAGTCALASEALHEVYVEVFMAFSALWVRKDPPDVMSFAAIFGEIKEEFRAKYPVLA